MSGTDKLFINLWENWCKELGWRGERENLYLCQEKEEGEKKSENLRMSEARLLF